MYVFRDGRRSVSGSELLAALRRELQRWQSSSAAEREDRALSALVAAGELECALLDSPTADGNSLSLAAKLTEQIAANFLDGIAPAPSILLATEQLPVSGSYQVAVQEGFAYYALHPRKMAMLLENLPRAARMAVVGIRSIGVTLSAVACAAMRRRGTPCTRINVRPTGHPYDRALELTDELRRWVAEAGDAGFLVVDEGPGISGSSFLAVAEGLMACGVEASRIQLVGSRQADASALRAAEAERRWPRFTFHVMQTAPIAPADAGESLSGGAWRRRFLCDEGTMPASWAPLEAAKFLSSDERTIFRFEGFGHYGEAIGRRARLLAAHGFSPAYLGNFSGFGRYRLLHGCRLLREDLAPELLVRMADYLALRAATLESREQQSPELETMLRWNWQQEFGTELGASECELRAERVVVCDGRVMPHEWLRTASGTVLKLDAASDGDNHFFPGPCDIAWDVAGAIVEWEMEEAVRKQFISEYEARTGDAVSRRLGPYLLAYTIFRLGWCKMAALAMQGEYDEALLLRDYRRYRQTAEKQRRGFEVLRFQGSKVA
jgi:hypothetical protein